MTVDTSELPRALVADDARVMRMLVRHWLERLGFVVDEAADGFEALRRARGGRYDLVVLDINMPGITGLGVLEGIRSDGGTRGLPVILLTTLGHEADMRRGARLGASAYLTKPLSFSALREAVSRLLLDGERTESNDAAAPGD